MKLPHMIRLKQTFDSMAVDDPPNQDLSRRCIVGMEKYLFKLAEKLAPCLPFEKTDMNIILEMETNKRQFKRGD